LQEGQIIKWLVEVGQAVTTADELCEVETEKAVIEIPVPFTGTVLELKVQEGENAAVGSVIAVFSNEENGDETAPTSITSDAVMASTPDLPTTPAPELTLSSTTQNTSKRARALPSIRNLAKKLGIDIQSLNGTGRKGRITRSDVMAAGENQSLATSTPRVAAPSLPGSFEKFSMIRRTISNNMTRSWNEIPHVFTRLEVDAENLLKFRKERGQELGLKIPLEAILISAAIPALIKYPHFNATVVDDGIQLHKPCNIGIAVDTPTGLVIPVVKNAQDMSFRKLVETLLDLLPRAVNRKATPEELTGATFTVNNIGAAGRLMGTSIIPLGTTSILSVGRATEKPVATNSMLGIAAVMDVTLSFDHRAIDGGLSQKFMAEIASNLENPGLLIP